MKFPLFPSRIVIIRPWLAILAGCSGSILQTLLRILLLVYEEIKCEQFCCTVQLHSIFLSCQVFKKEPTHFPYFFKCVMEACLSGEELCLSLREQTVLLLFLDHCFNSLVCINTFLISCNDLQYSPLLKMPFFPLDGSVVLKHNSDYQAIVICNEAFESCNDPMSF